MCYERVASCVCVYVRTCFGTTPPLFTRATFEWLRNTGHHQSNLRPTESLEVQPLAAAAMSQEQMGVRRGPQAGACAAVCWLPGAPGQHIQPGGQQQGLHIGIPLPSLTVLAERINWQTLAKPSRPPSTPRHIPFDPVTPCLGIYFSQLYSWTSV